MRLVWTAAMAFSAMVVVWPPTRRRSRPKMERNGHALLCHKTQSKKHRVLRTGAIRGYQGVAIGDCEPGDKGDAQCDTIAGMSTAA